MSSTAEPTDQANFSSTIGRLIRSLSSKDNQQPTSLDSSHHDPQPRTQAVSSDLPPPEASLPVATTDVDSELQQLNSQSISDGNSSTTHHQIPKQKLSAIDRFKNLRFFSKRDTRLEFPPRSWTDSDEGRDPAASTLPVPSTPSISITDTGSQLAEEPSPIVGTTSEVPPEPSFIARKIQELIDELPLPPEPSRFPPARTATPPATPELDSTPDGRPIPPPGSSSIKDPRLVALLSSASIMNGSIRRGKQSVWAMLDRLHAPKHQADDNGQGPSGSIGQPQEHADDDDDNSSIMLYSPLIPSSTSLVEIAESEMVPDVPLQVADGQVVEGDDSKWRSFKWRFKGGKGKERETERPNPMDEPSFGTTADSVAQSEEPKSTEPRIKEHRVWVPSPTKISLQATWWGYRLYLPPPVLDILSNHQLEAAKRAAMITTALKWLIGHLPVKLMPPQLRPAMFFLQRLIPFLGYIGGFIAWSWGAIKGYDKGNGVILTATWILPIALIPSTWEDDVPVADEAGLQQSHEASTVSQQVDAKPSTPASS